jgi:hypothetical protein
VDAAIIANTINGNTNALQQALQSVPLAPRRRLQHAVRLAEEVLQQKRRVLDLEQQLKACIRARDQERLKAERADMLLQRAPQPKQYLLQVRS